MFHMVRRGHHLTGALALAIALVGLTVAWVAWQEASLGVRDAERLMQAQANSIADLIGESGVHGFAVYGLWENEVAERLLDNAHWLARRDSVRRLTNADLGLFARQLHVGRINVFDRAGQKLATSADEADTGLTARHHPRDFIGPVLRGEVRELRIGFKPARFRGGHRFACAVARAGGGAIVVNVFADSMRAVLEAVSPAHVVGALGRADGVRYVVIDTRDSVLAATPPAAMAIASASSAFAPRDGRVALRQRHTVLGDALELERPLRLPGGVLARLRIGLDATPLARARSAARRRAWTGTLTVLTLATLGSVLVVGRQRQEWLAREIRRVRDELVASERAAQRAHRLVAMGEMAARVAHEVRNPLNTIHLTAQQLARDARLPEDLRPRALDVQSESDRIEGIVQQFLNLSRPRHPQLEPCDLLGLARAAVRAAEPAFAASGVSVRADGDAAPCRLDPLLMTEVLDNLLRNAREASPHGSDVQVRVARDGRRARLVIDDAGPGVPAELRERVFDPFFTTRAGGTGLGLSIVARLVEEMGGGLRLSGNERGGARLELSFPGDTV